jgi:hypothetical protein
MILQKLTLNWTTYPSGVTDAENNDRKLLLTLNWSRTSQSI